MLYKLGYIKLYISKTRIYQSFSEVPCHLNRCKLPFIYQTVLNNLNLLSFVINILKSIDTSQFLDRHIPFIYRIHWKQSTFHSFAIERRRHCFYYSNSFMIEENSDWIILYSVVNKHANKQGVKTETLCYINVSVNSLQKFINNEQYNAKQQTQRNIQIQTRLYQTSYISKYWLRYLGLRYIRFYCTWILDWWQWQWQWTMTMNLFPIYNIYNTLTYNMTILIS